MSGKTEKQEVSYESLNGVGSATSRNGLAVNLEGAKAKNIITSSPRRERAEVRKVYCDYSLGLFSKGNRLRHACIKIVESPIFEAVIIAAIVLNCTFLALTEPTRGPNEGRNKLVNDSEIPFSVLFILEAFIKVMAMGLFFEPTKAFRSTAKSQKKAKLGKYFPASVEYVYMPTYLRDGWNVLDFIVVVGGIISLSGTKSSISSIRTIRVLRPLRTISALPGMRILVGTIIRSLPMMGNVLLLSAFLFIVFGISGVQLFKGILRNRCFSVGPGSSLTLVDSERVCTMSGKYAWVGNVCGAGEVCREYENPNYGITSFDNILWAWLTIFQIITLEGWTPIMYHVMDATSGWSMFYFIMLIGLGAFFLINLAVGIVAEVYDQVQEEDEKEEEEEEENEEIDLYSYLDLNPEPEKGLWIKSLVQGFCKPVINHVLFDPFFTVMIVMNTILLAMEYDNMPKDYEHKLTVLNTILTYSFVVEMVLKIGGKQMLYFKDKSDLFDMFVTIVSMVETLATSNGSLTALRAFRILRILRIFRRWKSLQDFIKILSETVSNLGNFTFIVLLVIFIYALLGMDLFGNKFHFSDGRPRHNFDTLIWSILSVFQILTGEDWNAIMYDGIRATSSVSAFYFLSLILVGQYIILNLFIAILLANFEAQHLEDEEEEEKVAQGFTSKSKKTFHRMLVSARNRMTFAVQKIKSSVFGITRRESYLPGESGGNRNKVLEDERFHNFVENAKLLDLEDLQNLEEYNELDERQAELVRKIIEIKNKKSFSASSRDPFSRRHSLSFQYSKKEDGTVLHGKSLCIFPPDSKFRKMLFAIVDDRRFEYFILILILISSIAMACEVPRPSEKEKNFFYVLDVVFLVIFGLEAMMKITAFGFVFGKNHYIHDAWNCLDFLIVLMSFFGVALATLNVEGLSIFRVMRTLRPLRFLSRVPQLKVVVNALLKSVPALGNVAVISIIFYAICGILSMQLFMGKFHYCSSDLCCTASGNGTEHCSQVLTKYNCVGYAESATSGEECSWENERMNFDNIYNSLLTLFEMSTTEGWTTVMYAAVDATGKDKQRVRDYSPVVALYFLILMVFLSFFILNLFVGIILDTFSEMQRKNNYASNFLTPEQQTWVDSQKMAFTSTPKPVHIYSDSLKKDLLKWVDSSQFETGILVLIVTNVIFMMFEHENQQKWVSDTLIISNFVFTMIFLLEAVIKIITYSMNKINYFGNGWNKFDFVVVLFSVFGLISGNGGGASVLRVFRIARVFRLVKRLNGLNILFKTLLISLPTMLNVGGLMFIFFFIFAVLGMNLFGKVETSETYANFQHFGWSLLTLLRMSTGEAWNSIMEELMVQPPDCEKAKFPYCKNTTSAPAFGLAMYTQANCTGPDMSWITAVDNCGAADFAILYMVAFILFGSFIFLNLVIAVVLENFSLMLKLDAGPITPHDIRSFEAVWSTFDPRAKGYIMQADLKKLFFSTPPPLGLQGQRILPNDLETWIRELKLGDKPFKSYHEVLGSLLRRAVKENDVAASIPEEVKILMDIQLKKTLTKHEHNPIKKQTKYKKLANKADILFAVITIQRVCRRWLDKKKRGEEKATESESLEERATKLIKKKSFFENGGL
ncbi:ion transport protein [Chloropicon primus]|uniref:Ion transport protein n=1 Tax=Chloropicon primus TaxID=1764295 RepID=A0A5B8MVI2_9CHLO|nr:ion transport protein [Chloropicon primus]|eukprot:QDZ24407.1 ion transport protein [Chloropicon primus]